VESAFPAASSSFLTTDQIQALSGPVATQLISTGKLKTKIIEILEERKKSVASTCLQVKSLIP